MHHTKDKGDLGVAKAISRLVELQWTVAIPITEHASYDLIIEKEGVLLRVQVKYSSCKNSTIRTKLKNSWCDKNGVHSKLRSIGDFDLLAVYCPETDKVYFLQSKDFNNTSGINIRTELPRNYQKTGFRLASDYEII